MAKATTQEHVAITERQADVLELARLGLTFREIGRRIGISHEQARQDLNAALKATLRPAGDEVRKLHIERAEWMWLKAAEIAEHDTNPDRRLRALDRCSVALERMAKLEGTDAPTKAQVKVEHTSAADAELERLAQLLVSRAAEEGRVAVEGPA